MGLLLVRYAELGLKSHSVRRRFERTLVDNILSALVHRQLEAFVTSEQGRIFVETERTSEAVLAVSRVFGVASLSEALRCGADMEAMKRTAAEYSRPLLRSGQSFAVRARRAGTHQFTSTDVGREVGSAIWLANEDKKLKVDLSHPEVEIYVEVREKVAYIFTQYVPGPGGLPLGTQGRVLAVLDKDRDALATWLIMKRGCRAIGVGDRESGAAKLLREWDPDMKFVELEDIVSLARQHRALAVVYGYTLDQFEKIKTVSIPVPAFYPLVGMSEKEIEERLQAIRA